MTRLLLQILSVSDRYERRARLLPGLIVAATPAITAILLGYERLEWPAVVGLGVTVEVLLAFLLGQLARATGKRLEESLWNQWGGPPTTRWLRPWDNTCSETQKVKWRSAIKQLTSLSIPAAVTESRTEPDIDRIIGDATRQLRYTLRDNPSAGLVSIHNEEYGFARNLLGLRWLWLGLGLVSAATSAVVLLLQGTGIVALIVSVVLLVLAILVIRELPTYVRRCADRYAESLLAAAIVCAQKSDAGSKQGTE